jgi:hypothetical protein
VTDCGRAARYADRGFVERRLSEIAGGVTGVHGVALLPDGAFPIGEVIVIVAVEVSPYRWETNGLVLRAGAITGLVSRCGAWPEVMYPASAFIVPPPEPGAMPEPGLRSGVAVIDAFLDALDANDGVALRSLVDPMVVECVTEQHGAGAPPLCRGGEADGTTVEAIVVAGCEGVYLRLDEIDQLIDGLSQGRWLTFALLDLGADAAGTGFGEGSLQLLLMDADDRFVGRSLNFTRSGFGTLWLGCGPGGPSEMLMPGRAPDWLLAPP